MLDCASCNDSFMSLGTEYTNWWSLPPIFKQGRYVHATYSGVPDTPTGTVSVTAVLEYDEGGATQISTETVPLRINVGGPDTTLVDVLGATILSKGTSQLSAARATGFDLASAPQANGSVLIAADAGDPDWIADLYVCVKESDTCTGGDWLPATQVSGTPFWLYNFSPPSDGVYYVRAFAIDTCGTAGAASESDGGPNSYATGPGRRARTSRTRGTPSRACTSTAGPRAWNTSGRFRNTCSGTPRPPVSPQVFRP